MRGFEYLRNLAPTDGYFRNILGSILLRQQKPLPALQEYIWGLSIEPLDPHLAENTMRCLCGLGLFPAAVEVARHYKKIGGDPAAANLEPWSALARAVTAAVVTKAAKCSPAHILPDAPDLLDDFVVPNRPWLAQPQPAGAATADLGRARIFLSYRRAGGMNHAVRLERALKTAYPSMHVFRDETVLLAGESFIDQLRNQIDSADVFVAMIDSNWTGKSGHLSRLHDRDDILRRELLRALDQQIPILPVLLGDATMPAPQELPEELHSIREVHASRLSDATFDNDVGFLLSALTTLVEKHEAIRQQIREELEELEKQESTDPEKAGKRLQRLARPWVDRLPRFVERTSKDGQGVARERVKLEGIWECTATGPGGQVTLRFAADGAAGTPFEGEWRVSGAVAAQNARYEDIKGTWMPIYDLDKGLILGIFLDGLKSGAVFKLEIPFHRMLGRDLAGTGGDGVTWSSRNTAPRPGGF